MGPRIQVFLLVISIQILVVAAATNSIDVAALSALKSIWKNTPPNWIGSDPCGTSWEGISCTNSRVTVIILAGTDLKGSLSSDIISLSELQYLDLSNNKGLTGTLPSSIGNLNKLSILMLVGCSFFGPIPDSIGSLEELFFLSLNSNSFSGPIPPSIGNLSSLSWLDLTDNKLNGTIPISSGTTTGLDMLVNARHFHLGKNQLFGSIPSQLFSSNMNLIHAVLDNNQLTGNIPSTLGHVQTLEIVRLDWNSLDGSVPSNLNNLTIVSELYLSNNNLSGSVPNLTGMNLLNYVMMENTQLQGQIPPNLFSLPQLQTVVLSNNRLNGTLDVGTDYSNQLTLIDLQDNSITNLTQRTGSNIDLILAGNPICERAGATESYCTVQKPNSSNLIPSNNCASMECSSNKVTSPNCKCSHPYTGTLHFISFSFSNVKNLSYNKALVGSLMSAFLSTQLPVDSIFLSNPVIDVDSYVQFRTQIFPTGQDRFNRTGISGVGSLLNRNPLQLRSSFGPFFFIDESYCCFAGTGKSTNTGIIIGAAVGSSVLVLLLIGMGFYAFYQKRRAKRAAERNPFASWVPNKNSDSIPQLKGARWFSFEELKKCTGSFSEASIIGSGGYGKVYRGTLVSGQLVAIKRAQQGSLQGALEFKTEIELLSRIHHKNVVNLVGFCYEHGEQMLVYEYVPNGTLGENLSGKSRIQMDWMRRLSLALDSAQGLAYLHELADPPIIHRDIKSNNILLDDHLNAKVADFGLSKLMGDVKKGYVTTQVKGTLGYMDPEYYMTQQLTEKSDVYSFGVVLLELVTARAPIHRGKHIVREVKEAMEQSNDAYDLDEILDPRLETTPVGLDKFVVLAMRCVMDSAAERPTMGEVVREIENIIEMANANANLPTPSLSYETEGSIHNPYDNQDSVGYSAGFSALNIWHG
ncbi:Leucine-rich repeat receptor-like protein kinase precursor [Actinidia chinensis var. chinensis]|uniref:non-specific serine/threonine protein kinase n=1 Tax=Actinidia chinensis var. chinensis TaxID=1590841 RepID=A0A2R6R183_ACTCC|nr:Leucine-rich repeat receptor-like protein kinase precursor [Actinidia chinensis var. chinensis]